MTNAISTIYNLIGQIVERIETEERGHGAVEMAIVLAFMLVVTFGIIDFSRCIYTANVVKAAAQEGARAGLIDSSDIMETVEERMVGLDMNSVDVSISTSNGVVEVSVAYDFEFITPMVQSLLDSIILTGDASMVTM